MKLKSESLTVNGRVVWDPLLVFCRLRLMGDITRRCPLNGRDRPAPVKSCMPEIVREVGKMDYAAPRPLRAALPNAAEISLRDQTVQWLAHLERIDRVVLWGYAVGQSSRSIEGHLRDYLGVSLSYRAIQDRFARLIEALPRYWNVRGYEVDGVSLVAGQAACERQAMAVDRRAPRRDGIVYSRPEREAYAGVGVSRVILVDLPPPQHRLRLVRKSALQASQIRA